MSNRCDFCGLVESNDAPLRKVFADPKEFGSGFIRLPKKLVYVCVDCFRKRNVLKRLVEGKI